MAPMIFSANRASTAQPEISSRWEEVLPHLDERDFVVLRVLEDHGPRDAVQVAGTARLRPGGVLEALKKLDGLGIVRVEEPGSSEFQQRFALTGENLVPFAPSSSA